LLEIFLVGLNATCQKGDADGGQDRQSYQAHDWVSPYFSREPPDKPPPRRSITFSVVGGLVD
jgi:hypothetical protein